MSEVKETPENFCTGQYCVKVVRVCTILERLEPDLKRLGDYLTDPEKGLVIGYVTMKNRLSKLEEEQSNRAGWRRDLTGMVAGAIIAAASGWLSRKLGIA